MPSVRSCIHSLVGNRATGYSFLGTKESSAPGLSTTYARRHGWSSISRHLWPLPIWSSARRTSPGRTTNFSPSGVANSSVPDSVITNCGSGSGCQSYEECAGVSLKWMATTSVRSFSSIVPWSTCDALSAPVYNLNARTISLSPLNSFQHAGALIAASARGDLSSEHAVANHGVDQHEREHEQAFAPEHERKARMRSGGFLD